MKRFNCLIVDDEPVARRILKGYLNDLTGFSIVGSCANAIAAGNILQKKKVDLLFLDLEMPKLKGFPFLRTLKNPPSVIITTAHRKYALEGYELEVLDYLLKPISLPRFMKAVNRFRKSQEVAPSYLSQSEGHIFVIHNRKTLRLEKNEIRFIQGMNNYVRIKYTNREYIIYSSLQKIKAKLGKDFVRIHKSFIINRARITAFNRSVVEIDGMKINVGNRYQDVLNSLLI